MQDRESRTPAELGFPHVWMKKVGWGLDLVDISISVLLPSHLSVPFEVQKKCGVVQKDTLYTISWN